MVSEFHHMENHASRLANSMRASNRSGYRLPTGPNPPEKLLARVINARHELGTRTGRIAGRRPHSRRTLFNRTARRSAVRKTASLSSGPRCFANAGPAISKIPKGRSVYATAPCAPSSAGLRQWWFRSHRELPGLQPGRKGTLQKLDPTRNKEPAGGNAGLGRLVDLTRTLYCAATH